MRVFDSFMFRDEFDILECRLYELQDVPNLVHIAVEANVDHQDHPKPFHLTENMDRFDQWRDRLIVVRAKGLPPKTFDPDPWAREHAQREYVRFGLEEADAQRDDVILHGDVDEIPTALVCRNIRPNGFVSFTQRGHFWAVDWLYPEPWFGTVAARVGAVDSFGAMRDKRNMAPKLPNAGWHLSWLGGRDAARTKVDSFCHPEVDLRIRDGLDNDQFMRDGVHVDGLRMLPVEVDNSWPRWIVEGKCPASWYRANVPALS